MPEATPVTIPVAEPMPAIAELLLLQVPVPPLLLTVAVAPMQTLPAPVIAGGNGFTVSVRVMEQPVEESVKVMVVVPAATPLTTPVAMLIVAVPVLLLAHVPPPALLLKVADEPTHTAAAPDMAGGGPLTVILVVVKQPVEAV